MPTPYHPKLATGESAELECLDCGNSQFQVVLEPSYTDPAMAKAFGGAPRTVKFCPFCGGDNLSEV